MQISPEALFTIALTLISGLGGVAWKLLRLEQSRMQARQDLSASRQELSEAEARHAKALADSVERHAHDLEVVREHFHSRLADMVSHQNRENERVKSEMDDIKNNLREFQRETQQSFATSRREQQEGVDRVLTRMQELLVSIKSAK